MLSLPFLLLLAQGEPAPPPEKTFQVEKGTRIPLTLLRSVSTKNAVEGDAVYLETLFPVLVDGRIVIPAHSNVKGTVTQVKRAGRVKGRAELYVRFDTLILPNATLRDFRARPVTLDGAAPGKMDREEGKVEGDGNKSGDARVLADAAMSGTFIGTVAGAAAGRAGMGAGIGAAAGATAAMIGILATRGPDAMLQQGSSVEMMLDRTLSFSEEEIDFGSAAPARRTAVREPAAPRPAERPGFRRGPVGIP